MGKRDRERFAAITGLQPIGPDWDAGAARAQFYQELEKLIELAGEQHRLEIMYGRALFGEMARGKRLRVDINTDA